MKMPADGLALDGYQLGMTKRLRSSVCDFNRSSTVAANYGATGGLGSVFATLSKRRPPVPSCDATGFPEKSRPLRDGLGLAVVAKLRQNPVHADEACFPCGPQPKVVIHDVVKRLVEVPNPVEEVSSEEDRRLRNRPVDSVQLLVEIVGRSGVRGHHATVCVDDLPVPKDEIPVAGRQGRHSGRECPVRVSIVSVQPADDLARRLTEARIDCVALSPVGARPRSPGGSRYPCTAQGRRSSNRSSRSRR